MVRRHLADGDLVKVRAAAATWVLKVLDRPPLRAGQCFCAT